MLTQLSIRDIVLIDQLDLEFLSGLSALTGETGAGKSIVLDALSLALGARGDASLVRAGALQGQVTAVFSLPHNVAIWALLSEQGIEPADVLVCRRVQSADGKSRAFIQDVPVSVQLLRSVGQCLVEIHGQHDDRAFVDASSHRVLLDSFAGLEEKAEEVGSVYTDLRRLEKTIASEEARLTALANEAEWLRHAVAELEALAPEAGEEQLLAEKRQHMQRSEKIAVELNEVCEAFSHPASPVSEINSLSRRLARCEAEMPDLLPRAVAALDRALDALGEAEQLLQEALHRTQFDPRALENAEERLFALRAAARKYQVPADDLAAHAVKLADDLAALDGSSRSLEAMRHEAGALRQRLMGLARVLSEKRAAAAMQLSAAVQAELAPLKLGQARFFVEVISDENRLSSSGIDDVGFMVQTNPGTQAGLMQKIASGGELSRFMLALKVALADRGSAPTLIFDEIDSGVGGAVAEAIGARLAALGSQVQVIAVTHAPQVAAQAAQHYLIAKEQGSEQTRTHVRTLHHDEAGEEIARMLAGAHITDEARAAARRLMARSV